MAGEANEIKAEKNTGGKGTGTTPKKRREGIPFREVQKLLGLQRWEMFLALDTGLLSTLPDGSYNTASVEIALSDPTWTDRLKAQRWLNATEAAKQLGITTERFRRVVQTTGLKPVGTENWKYGRIIRYFRSCDVDSLMSLVALDVAERHVAAAENRTASAKKAAATRAHKLLLQKEARDLIALSEPTDDTHPVTALIWSFALSLNRYANRYTIPKHPLLQFIKDGKVKKAAAIVAQARFKPDEMIPLFDKAESIIRNRLSELSSVNETVYAIRPCRLVDVDKHMLLIAKRAAAVDIEQLKFDPPTWFSDLQNMAKIRQQLHDAEQKRAKQERETEKSVNNIFNNYLSDEAVAEIFGLSIDTVRQLRLTSKTGVYKNGKWGLDYIDTLVGNKPKWITSEKNAQFEVNRRREKKRRIKKTRAQKYRQKRE
ncbi:MAG: hypothetical protein M1483_06925 [Actinobacteria bacterium]|nr:hypothetical protein [Actinomycetota bacterium]MCL6105341.1 hypothetical protein [Actinomycetota bacterium]